MYIAAVVLLTLSYHAAAFQWPAPIASILFWAAVAPPFLLTAFFVSSAHTSPRVAQSALTALAAFGALPKLLRTPAGPLYFDELMHWRQASDLAQTGVVGAANSTLPVLRDFPGLHDLTASLEQLSGAPTWTVASLIAVACHVAGILGVYALIRLALSGTSLGDGTTSRVAGLGAVLYAMNAGWMYFNTQYGYESLAVPLVVWGIVFAAAAPMASGRRRIALLAGVGLFAIGTAVTHHASAIVLALAAIVLAVLTWLGPGSARRSAGVAAITAALTTVVVAGWLVRDPSLLLNYLGPYLGSAWDQLARLTQMGGPSGAAAHPLFAGSTLPPYEIAAALLTPLLVLAVVAAPWIPRVRASWRTPVVALIARPLGGLLTVAMLAYFASLPLLLSGANEVARRSWTYSWLGVAFAIALILQPALTHLQLRRWWSTTAACALLMVLLVGNIAAGENEAYRFPGPRQDGSDTRSLDAELRNLSTWMSESAEPNAWISTDRYSAAILASVGGARLVIPWSQLPLWDLVAKDGSMNPQLVSGLRTSSIAYLVVDDRMATTAPASGFWYDVNEPSSVHDQTMPVPAVRRFDCLPWSSSVYSSEHYTVYRLDMSKYSSAVEARVVAGLSRLAGPDSAAASRRSQQVLAARECLG